MTHLGLLVKADSEDVLLKLREQLADMIHIAGARLIYTRISEIPIRILSGREGTNDTAPGQGGKVEL